MRILLGLLVAAALATSGVGVTASNGPASAGNGYILMVHGEVRPWLDMIAPEGAPVPPPVPEAAVGMREGESVLLRAIVYDVENGKPVDVDDATLHVWSNAEVTVFTPEDTSVAAADPVCVEETTLPGYEGDPSWCQLFALDAEWATGRNVVTLRLHFEDAAGAQVEVYNAIAHGLLHDSHMNGDSGREQADWMGDPTPFMLASVVDAGLGLDG